jgi:uncharacterized protein
VSTIPAKPVGMTPEEEWLWDNTASGSWQRRMLARAYREANKERLRAPLYVRFGDPPRVDARYGGRSLAEVRQKRDGPKLERGVSCFRGYWAADGVLVVDVSKSFAQLEMYKMVVREGRPVYLLTGREAAEGSDGEPVLTDAKFEPVPAGTRVRCSGDRQDRASTVYAVASVVTSLGLVVAPRWAWEPPPEMVVAGPEAPAATVVRDVPALLEAVLARSTIKDSGVHGEVHWKRVAVAGARLAAGTPGADRLVVFLFAVLHDSQRVYEGYDAWHGRRAADLARNLLGGGGLLFAGQLETLAHALEAHDEGYTTSNPTVGVCWDADRLCLWRIGVTPDPKLLSTPAAKDPETIRWARGLQGAFFEWPHLYADFGRRAASRVFARGTGASSPLLEEAMRGHLKRWGMLEDYDRYFGQNGITGGGGR